MALGNSTQQTTSANPSLYTKEISDIWSRQNFQALVAYFKANNQLSGFNFFEVIETGVVTKKALAHNLGNLPQSSPAGQVTPNPTTASPGVVPKDIVLTQVTGPGTLQFLFGLFDEKNIYYTTTGACRVRFFVGTYCNDSSQVQAQSTDTQTVSATP